MYLPSTAVRRRINVSISRKKKSMAPRTPALTAACYAMDAVAEDRGLEEREGPENLKISVLLSKSEDHRMKE